MATVKQLLPSKADADDESKTAADQTVHNL